jgi:heavy metal translocating P-type ATPase
MSKTLEDVGFEICGVDSTVDSFESSESIRGVDLSESSWAVPSEGGAFEALSRLWRSKKTPVSLDEARAAHLANCESCRAAAADGASKDIDSRPNSTISTDTNAHLIPNTLNGVVTDDDAASNGPWRATLSVGGMTCAVCVNTITSELEKNSWVLKPVVNLVSNSATVDFNDPKRTQDIVEAIEDLGYDVTIDKVVDLSELNKHTDTRDVEIRVDGIFCPRCPERIIRTLHSFGTDNVQIEKGPSTTQPFLKLRYTPSAPLFTIRHILRAIEATDPSLTATIYHPPTLEERSRVIRAKHQRALFVRLILAVVLGIPSLVLGIVYMSLVSDSNPTKHFLMKPWVSGLSRNEIILFCLATPVYFFGADVFHVRAVKELRTLWRSGSRTSLAQRFYKFGSMNLLISLGTTIAYISSVAQMIAAGVNKEADVPEDRFYFDSVVFLTLFLLAGRLIEAYSKSKTGNAVEALAKLRPSTALLVEPDTIKGGSQTTTVDIDHLEHGDMIRVPHGASPAADGIIISGESNFDESSLTGESRPIKKKDGDEVFAGTVNKGAAITIRITGTSGKSMLDQIVEVVREGQTKRAPVEQVADLLTSYFVPVITLIAIITWVVWMILVQTGKVSGEELNSSGGRIAFAFQFAIAVFVVACPCGLGLAAPTAIFVGGGLAAKHGILAKGGGEAFEKASRIDCVVFDKTGTLTVGGEPQITDSFIFPEGEINGISESTVLSGLKALEESSTHPIARAIVAFCGTHRPSAELDAVEEIPGKGMRATFSSKPLDIAVGNEALMRDLDIQISPSTAAALETWKADAKSVALVAVKDHNAAATWHLAASLAISDPIRTEAAPVIAALQKRGTQVWMLSGDNVTTARAVAKRVNIPADNVLAEVLPSEKAAKVSYLQATLTSSARGQRAMVAMVGDGINDSPALTTADVGIAIGSGSDVAISSADFVLASSRLSAVLTLLDLSKVVFRRIRVNFGWAVVYNMIAVPVAAGTLYAVETSSGAHVKLDPVWASLAMALSSLSVVLSSLSLRSPIPGVGFRAKKFKFEE